MNELIRGNQDHHRSNSDDWQLSDPSLVEQNLFLELRYVGTDVTLTVNWTGSNQDESQITQAFHAMHRARYSYDRPTRPVELVAVRLEVSRHTATDFEIHWSDALDSRENSKEIEFSSQHSVRYRGTALPTKLVRVQDLQFGATFEGPAVVLSPGSTLTIEPGWQVQVGSDGTLLLTRQAEASSTNETILEASNAASGQDPVAEAVFAQRLGGDCNANGSGSAANGTQCQRETASRL